jgi:hypothetical protein
MPLINVIREDPQFKRRMVERSFSDLPESDKMAVINIVESGRAGQPPGEIELSGEGQEFIRTPEFREIYERRQGPPVNPMMPVIAGLMEVIAQHQATHPPAVPHGHLKPEFGDRVGGTPQHAPSAGIHWRGKSWQHPH